MSSHEQPYLDRLRDLVGLLSQAPRIQRIALRSTSGDPLEVATEAAASLLDIGEAWRHVSNELVPRLQTLDPASGEFEDTLDDIAEEWRHISYHILHTALFDYVVNRD